MKTILILITLCISTLVFSSEKCDFDTTTKSYSSWGGSPWSPNTSYTKRVTPEGACENLGDEDELTCRKQMLKRGFTCYQMTKGNSYRRYDGTLWGGVKRKYDLCFVCYK